MARRRRAPSARRRQAKSKGFRSGLEQELAEHLEGKGIRYEYEPKESKMPYTPKTRVYLPDFVLPNGVILESKGRLTSDDRVKHLLLKEQHPDADIRFVFKVDNKLSPKSPTRYSEWCEKNGFPYCFIGDGVPDEWLS